MRIHNPPNVGVSRAAGSRRERTSWRHELALKSRAQVGAAPAASGCTPCWAGRRRIVRHRSMGTTGVYGSRRRRSVQAIRMRADAQEQRRAQLNRKRTLPTVQYPPNDLSLSIYYDPILHSGAAQSLSQSNCSETAIVLAHSS